MISEFSGNPNGSCAQTIERLGHSWKTFVDIRQSKLLHHDHRQSKFSERAVLLSYTLQGTSPSTRISKNDKNPHFGP